jgi:urease accessory protein
MLERQALSLHLSPKSWQSHLLAILTVAFLTLGSLPALAHHAMAGRTPSNFVEGFLTGLAHPLIGFDHFAFIIAVGLLAAIKQHGLFIPIAFMLSAMLGTGLHLLGFNLPEAELFVSGSILLFGLLLVIKNRPNTVVVTALAAIAGICHGYAYGESIIGAEMTPLVAYLLGFTSTQIVVSGIAFAVSKAMLQPNQPQKMPLRSAGFVFCGIGGAFFYSQLVSVVLPLPKG